MKEKLMQPCEAIMDDMKEPFCVLARITFIEQVNETVTISVILLPDWKNKRNKKHKTYSDEHELPT